MPGPVTRRVAVAACAVAMLAGAPPAVADAPVDGNCEVADADDTENDVRALAVVVHAKSTELLALTAACTVTWATGRRTIRTETFGPVVAAADWLVLPRGPVELCLRIWNGLYYGRQLVAEPPCRTV